MEYGYFSEDGQEYIITNPETPLPWRNFSWNDTYLMCMDQTGSGQSQYSPRDQGNRSLLIDSRKIYIQNEKHSWNIGYTPICEKPQEYRCRVGLHYSVIEQKNHDILSSWTMFVPKDIPVEIWILKIENLSQSPVNIKLFPGVHFRIDTFDIAVPPHQMLTDAYFDKKNNLIWARNRSYERPNDNYSAFFASDEKVIGYDVLSTLTYDNYRGSRWPLFLNNGCTSRDGGDTNQSVGYLEQHIELQPSESKKLHYILGSKYDQNEMICWISQLFSNNKIEKELDCKIQSAQKNLKSVNIETSIKLLDNIANTWCKHQTILGTQWARIYVIGVRDILQDAQGIMSISPSIGQKGLLAALKHQNKDGSAIRCWDPTLPAKPSDCHMWITLTLTEYIKETGDYSILEHTIPYFDSGKATILEHWLGSLEFMYDNRGSHGLCLIFDCDWNDSMTVGKKGLGESVLTTQSAIYAMKESLPLFEKLKLYEKIKCFEERIEELTEICNDVAWDGKWYIRAFNDEGEIIGSSKNLELGEIYLNTQTWAVLSGIADAKKFELMDDQVEKKLLCKYGYKICHPGYKEPVPSLARIGSMNFGIYENNSVYCHANTFKIISEYLLGRYDKAWQIAKLMFTNRNFNPSANESGAEPYAFTNQFMSPDSPTPGKSCIGWITGTASWMNQILLKYIPGVLPDYDGLKIIPSIPSEINCLKLKRYFRGAFYNFDIALDNSIGTDEIYIELNNKELSSNVIPVQHAKSVNKVVVRYSR